MAALSWRLPRRALYLPGTTTARRSAAADWMAERSAAKGEFEVAIPIRRVVAMRARPALDPA